MRINQRIICLKPIHDAIKLRKKERKKEREKERKRERKKGRKKERKKEREKEHASDGVRARVNFQSSSLFNWFILNASRAYH